MIVAASGAALLLAAGAAQAWTLTTSSYAAKDNNIPTLPLTFPSWPTVDISASGTAVPLTWRAWSGPFSISGYDHYGTPRSQFWLDSCGTIYFTAITSYDCTVDPIGDASWTRNDLVQLFHNSDMDYAPSCGPGQVDHQTVTLPPSQVAPSAQVVQWTDANIIWCSGTVYQRITAQARFYANTDVIELLYLDSGNAVSTSSGYESSVGIRGGTASTAMERFYWNCCTVQTFDNQILQFRPPNVRAMSVNDGPITFNTNFLAVTTLNVPVASGVLANDRVIGHAPIRATLQSGSLSGPYAGGTLVLNPDGSFDFTLPNVPNPCGTYTFRYWAEDAWGYDTANPATVTIDVINCNTAPVAQAQSVMTLEDTPLAIVLAATDADNNPLTYSLVAPPSFGTLSPFPGTPQPTPPTVTYTPNTDTYRKVGMAAESFRFRVDDGIATHEATITIDLRPVNDAPVLSVQPISDLEDTAVSRAAAAYVLTFERAASPTALAFDESAQALTLSIQTPCDTTFFSACPALGSGNTLTYTPAPNANGNRVLTLRATDDGTHQYGGTATIPATPLFAEASLQVTVRAVNDAPLLSLAPSVTDNEDTPVATAAWLVAAAPGPASAVDEADQALAFSVDTPCDTAFFASCPGIVGGQLTYTPAQDVFGTRTLTLRVSDDGTDNGGTPNVLHATAQLDVVVSPINDPPTIAPLSVVTVAEDSNSASQPQRRHAIPAWTTLTTGPSNEAQTFATIGMSGHDGTLFAVQPALAADGTLTFELAPDKWGTTSGTLTVRDSGPDGGLHDAVTTVAYTLQVSPVNDPPVANPDSLAVLYRDVPEQEILHAAVLANDADVEGSVLSIQAFTHVTGGTMEQGPAGRFLFTPTPGYVGPAGFRYRATDGLLASNEAIVTFQVIEPPEPIVFLQGPAGRVCAGDTVSLRAIAVWAGHMATRWTWDAGDGTPTVTVEAPATASTRLHTYATAGPGLTAYMPTVHVRFADGGGNLVGTAPGVGLSWPLALRVDACRAPLAAFDAVMTGLQGAFADASSDPDGTALTYLWEFGDGGTSTLRNPLHLYASPGIRTVRLTVTDAEGDTAVAERIFTINALGAASGGPVGGSIEQVAGDGGPAALPPAPVNRPPVAAAVGVLATVGQPVTLDASPSRDDDGDTLGYQWTQVAGPTVTLDGADTARPTFRAPTAAGRLIFEVTVSDGHASDVAQATVDVVALAAPSAGPSRAAFDARVVGGSTFAFLGAPEGSAHSWDFGDGTTSSQRAPSHTYTVPGTYTIVLRVTNAGGVTESSRTVVVQGAQDVPANEEDVSSVSASGGVGTAAWIALAAVGGLAVVAAGALGTVSLRRR